MPSPAAPAGTNVGSTSRPLDACTEKRWLFVYSTGGRTGSTTMLAMLNAVPQLSVTGENGDLFGKLERMRQETMQLPRTRDASDPWMNDVDAERIQVAICTWLQALSPRPSALVHGFKEIRATSAAAAARSFPINSRFIVSYRTNTTEQVRSFGSLRKGVFDATDEESFLDTMGYLRNATRGRRVFLLPVERFNVRAFNLLLRWLGVEGCEYTRVVHANAQYDSAGKRFAGGYTRVSNTGGLLRGTCRLTTAMWDASQRGTTVTRWPERHQAPGTLNANGHQPLKANSRSGTGTWGLAKAGSGGDAVSERQM